ncbi:MAG: hypothetical protein C0615_07140 [Desulfuromonas sp.]|nr:MAG: hypothetical protein C0615_07140 [Desulfuromonas sp.]
MTPKQKHILLASATDLFEPLATLLEQSGVKVSICRDGAQALEMALKFTPDILIVDNAITVLAVDKMAQILRANSQSEKTPIFFVGPEGEQIEGFRRQIDHYVPRPFNNEQLLAEILTRFSREEKNESIGQAHTEVEGDLGQIPLTDLLQVFSLNRKDGVISVSDQDKKGYIHLLEGQVISSRVGQVVGEKAFFRLLQWESGKFRFTPGNPQVERRINMPTDQLLIEGMRQNDEMRSQMSTFPAGRKYYELSVPFGHLPEGLRPATLEIAKLFDGPTQVMTVVESSMRSDYEVLQVLRALIEQGLLKETTAPGKKDGAALLLDDEMVVAIKEFFGERENLLEESSAKLIVLAENDEQAGLFLQALQGVDEFEPESDFLHGDGGLSLGDIGRLEISETFHLRLFLLPATEESAPLWRPFCHRLFGVLSLATDISLHEAENYFFESARVPVAKCRDNENFNDVLPLRRGDRDGLRRLLHYFAAPFTGKEQEVGL